MSKYLELVNESVMAPTPTPYANGVENSNMPVVDIVIFDSEHKPILARRGVIITAFGSQSTLNNYVNNLYELNKNASEIYSIIPELYTQTLTRMTDKEYYEYIKANGFLHVKAEKMSTEDAAYDGTINTDSVNVIGDVENKAIIEEAVKRTYKGYKIIDNDEGVVVVTPQGVEDAEFDNEIQAISWIDNKQSNSADKIITKLFSNARRLRPSQIDRLLTFEAQQICDPDNTFIVKFKTKRDRISGEKLAKQNGFLVVDRTDDDESKIPFWSFFSIDGSDRWLNETYNKESFITSRDRESMDYKKVSNELLFTYHKNLDFVYKVLGEFLYQTENFTRDFAKSYNTSEGKVYISWLKFHDWNICPLDDIKNLRERLNIKEHSYSNLTGSNSIAAAEEAYFNNNLDDFVFDACIDGSLSYNDLMDIAKQSSVIEIDDMTRAINNTKHLRASKLSNEGLKSINESIDTKYVI